MRFSISRSVVLPAALLFVACAAGCDCLPFCDSRQRAEFADSMQDFGEHSLEVLAYAAVIAGYFFFVFYGGGGCGRGYAPPYCPPGHDFW